MKNILIVEDDNALAEGLIRALSSEQIKPISCGTVKQARQYLKKEKLDLLLLDINLPDGNGLDFLKEIREKSNMSNIPIILLTANDLEMDIVNGLELGADDYITKPFSLAVLRARVHTQLKKRRIKSERCYRSEKYHFDFESIEFFVNQQRVELSKTEQKLLLLLTEHEGITLKREILIDRIWTDGAEYVDENALSVTIKRLRDKLDAKEQIQTVYGVGYIWKNGL